MRLNNSLGNNKADRSRPTSPELKIPRQVESEPSLLVEEYSESNPPPDDPDVEHPHMDLDNFIGMQYIFML
jgi:hypothetical protein